MKVVTVDEMRTIDRRTIEEAEIPGLDLMERAGQGVVQSAVELLGNSRGKVVIIFCGKGNNGGDGFVVARLLAQAEARPKVYLVGRKEELKGDTLENLRRLQKLEIHVEELSQAGAMRDLSAADLIIDALLGTGLSGRVDGLMAEVVELINRSGVPVLAVDIPSGIDADNGQVLGCAVRAKRTATMAFPKRGFFFSPARELVGTLAVVDIGVPDWIVAEQQLMVEALDSWEMNQMIPARAADAHKGSFGRVLILAGSVGLTGAAALTSMAVLRSGAGMAILGVPESLNDIMATKLTEVMTSPLPETRSRTLSLKAMEAIHQLLGWADVLAIGPGLSTHQETVQLVRKLLPQLSCPTVVDADGLNAIAQDTRVLAELKAPVVLTPHAGEIARLSGIEIPRKVEERISAVVEFARQYAVVCVFKGSPTLIADPKGRLFINTTGNPGMGTAGAGDVLTGMIAGLMAQGLSPLDAARLGVYLHGLAGDVAREKRGEWSLVAGDLVEDIGAAIFRTCGQKARRRGAPDE